jgi:hypothetical protein
MNPIINKNNKIGLKNKIPIKEKNISKNLVIIYNV